MKKILLILLTSFFLLSCSNTPSKTTPSQVDTSSAISIEQTGLIESVNQSIYKDTTREYILHSVYLSEKGLVIDLVLDEGCSNYVEYTFKNLTVNGITFNFKKCDFVGETNKSDNLHHHYITIKKETLQSKGITEIDFLYFEFYYTFSSQIYGGSYLFSTDTTDPTPYLNEIKNKDEYFSEHQYSLVDWTLPTDIPIEGIKYLTESSTFEFDYWLTTIDNKIYKVTQQDGLLTSKYYKTSNYLLVNGNLFLASGKNYMKDKPAGDPGYSMMTDIAEGNTSYFRIQPTVEYHDSEELYENERYAFLSEDGKIYAVDTKHSKDNWDESEFERTFINQKELYSFEDETILQISACYLLNKMGYGHDGYVLFILTDKGYYYETIQGEYHKAETEEGKSTIDYTITLVQDKFISSIADRVQLIFDEYILLDDGRIFKNQNTFCTQINIK